jgi:hypothetical protein
MDIKNDSLAGLLRHMKVARACTKDLKASIVCLKLSHDNLARHLGLS